jgi:ElaB/YqjD/DUF883 family membrane-anchored ribosome-binding protein
VCFSVPNLNPSVIMNTDANTEQIVRDLKTVARDAEDLIKATAGEVSDKARDARARLSTALSAAKETCDRWEEKAVAGAKATDKVVRDHPYEAVGIAFVAGALLGVLLTRK